jgi:hypothetical protein
MSKIIFFLFVIVSCATPKPTISTGHQVVKRSYYEIQGAGDVLRKTNQATLAIWIWPKGKLETSQHIFNFSVGGDNLPWKSRAEIVLLKGGSLSSTARADDKEEPSQIFTKADLIKPNLWNHITLTIDYTQKKMQFFVNGEKVSAVQELYRFTKPETSDTSSLRAAFGSEDDGSGAYFVGEIAGAFVGRKILSENEIKEVMRNSLPPK